MVFLLAMGIPAGAAPGEIQSKQAEIDEAQQRLKEIRTQASLSFESYNGALSGLNDLDDQIADTERDLEGARDRVDEAQRNLEEAATQVYKSGNVAFIDVLVGSEDFSEFASRMDLWMRLLAEERARFDAVLKAKNELETEQARLEDQREERVDTVEEAVTEKDQAESAEVEARSYLESLDAGLRAAMEAEQVRRAEEARAAAVAVAAAQAAPAPDLARTAPDVSRAEQEAAERRAAERAEARLAAEAAAKEKERQAELAAREAAAKEREEQRALARQAAEERRAEARAARQEAKRAAVEQAAAERRAQELAAQREAEEQAAAEQATAEQTAAGQTTPEPTAASAPAPAASGGSCGDTFGGVQPHVAEVGCAVRAQFGIQTIYGMRAGDPGDHGSGLALDIMTYSDTALGQQVADYLLANQGQFGINYIMWNRQINFGSGWQPVEDRGSPTANHEDHVHASFY